MANVTFSATKYTGTGVPTGVADSAFNGAKVTATSAPSGLADFTGLADGYYLFHQVTTVNGITTVGDFIVQVNHNDRDRKSTRLNSSHLKLSRMPSSA